MKKFLVMAIVALSMVFTSCGVTGLNNIPVCDDQAGTINGRAYDNETYKCWKIEWWSTEIEAGEEPVNSSDIEYAWATTYQINKAWMTWKAAANLNVAGYTNNSGDYKLTEVQDRTDETCYDTYGQ